MNELQDKLAELDAFLLDKIWAMKDKNCVNAAIEARRKINEAQIIIALANK